MKKRSAVFWLFARSTIFFVIGIAALMLIAETILFLPNIDAVTSIDRTIEKSRISLVFKFALALITVVLCMPGRNAGARADYTIKRLSIGEGEVYLYQAIYNTIVYFIVFAIQAAFAFALCNYKISVTPSELVSNQSLFLAFHQNTFLHSLLPMEDIALHFRNLMLILMLGASSALFPYMQRRKKFSSAALAVVLFTMFWFDQELGNYVHTFITAIIFVILAFHIIYVVKGDEENE